jgi:hypothetical protein
VWCVCVYVIVLCRFGVLPWVLLWLGRSWKSNVTASPGGVFHRSPNVLDMQRTAPSNGCTAWLIMACIKQPVPQIGDISIAGATLHDCSQYSDGVLCIVPWSASLASRKK